MLTAGQQQALASLLTDPDPHTRQLLIGELAAQQARYGEIVREFARSSDPALRHSAQEILAHWDVPEDAPHPCQQFLELSSPTTGPRTWHDLENFCWILARTEYHDLDAPAYTRTLDLWADRAQAIAGPHPAAAEAARALRIILAEENGLRGNRSNYYAPANSYLNRVLETRLGIPLSLSLIYIFTAHRAGWDAWGINTPGHYLCAVQGLILDPYHGGILLSPESLAARFALPASICQKPDFFRASPIETAMRMLANLQMAYQRVGDKARARRIRTYLRLLAENST